MSCPISVLLKLGLVQCAIDTVLLRPGLVLCAMETVSCPIFVLLVQCNGLMEHSSVLVAESYLSHCAYIQICIIVADIMPADLERLV